MSGEASLTIGSGPPETVLPPPPGEWQADLALALRSGERGAPGTAGAGDLRARVAAVAAAHPRFMEAWVELVDLARDDVEAYAYRRASATTAASTRCAAPVGAAPGTCAGGTRRTACSSAPWRRCAVARRRSARPTRRSAAALFLRQLDPEWRGLPVE